MVMRCPRCRAVAKTRTSVELSILVRRSYHQCQNMLCGYCFTPMTEIDGSLNQTQPAPARWFRRMYFREVITGRISYLLRSEIPACDETGIFILSGQDHLIRFNSNYVTIYMEIRLNGIS